MVVYEIKFKFENKLISKKELDYLFNIISDTISFQFDEELNVYPKRPEEIYQYMDVSNKTIEDIEEITESFFNFTFKEIIDVPLYKFLVLKNEDNISILAIIHPLIFDYTSINNFYEFFNNPNNNISLENNIVSQHDISTEYLTSSDFENDANYWKKNLFNIGEYIKFYNIKSNNYKNIKIFPNNETLSNFLNENNISKFNFITSVFSLYLSRINRTKGCLLKTIIPSNKNDLTHYDKDTLLKIEFLKDKSFIEYLNNVKDIYNVASQHTKS